jgi:hypothetical protein
MERDMTTIGSTNPYLSLYSALGKNAATTSSGDEDQGYSLPKQYLPDAATGAETVAAPKLADALWALESGDSASATTGAAGDDTVEDVAAEFSALAHMTLADRIRAQYLEDNDLTEDSLKSMSADDRSAIEDEIRKAVEKALGVDQTKDKATAAMTDTSEA